MLEFYPNNTIALRRKGRLWSDISNQRANQAPFGKWEESGWMTGVHNVLDVAGLIPGIGEIADGLNAAIYILEGDKANAAFSAAAMIPFAGWGATGVKFAKKLDSGIRQASATGTQRTPYDNFG